MPLPFFIPLGVSLARIHRNYNDDGVNEVKKVRGRAIIDKLVAGGANAPITEWSEAKLEKAIRNNSIFREHCNELRTARMNGLVRGAQGTQSVPKEDQQLRRTVSVMKRVKEVDQRKVEEEASQPELGHGSFGQADLLYLAAEEKSEKAEENIVKAAALEALADNSFDAILVTDMMGKIAYSNKAFTKLTGYEQEDVIGKSPKLLQGPGTDQTVLDRLKDSMKWGRGDYEGSAINYRKNGTPFIMHWRVVPVKVGEEIKAWVAIQREGSQIPARDIQLAE